MPPRSLAWPELSCTAGAITTFRAITALGRSKCSRTSLQRRTELQPLRAPRHPLRAAALSRQRFAAAFRTDKASHRVRCLHPCVATHVCVSYRSGAPRKASPRTARGMSKSSSTSDGARRLMLRPVRPRPDFQVTEVQERGGIFYVGVSRAMEAHNKAEEP